MWGVEFQSQEPFVYCMLGVQYQGNEPNKTQATLINALDSIMGSRSDHVEKLVQNGNGHLTGWKTRTWLTYWETKDKFEEWWNDARTVQFWGSLAPDAGVWREVLRVSPCRTQFGTNKETVTGLAHVAPLVPNVENSGYWGCYRDRIQDATEENRLESPLSACPDRNPPQQAGKVRLGRSKMTTFPDNLCFVVEGQDHSLITDQERQLWFAKFDKPVTRWMQDLVQAGPKAGILDARVCYESESGLFRHEDSIPALNYNRKIQLFYFLDMSHMEAIGKANKGHTALRGEFLKAYCPAGPMGGGRGQVLLWVETSVMKTNEMECEYVGCAEGTGFMAYDQHALFRGTYE
ncbi:heme-containing dehydratase protein [Pseudomassariella vexata]|uniref:Heme-containing dehydratase protein n=1 Tax=Pseudomassariella vexata TaxID=1141098 RepID=A0A1Y2DJE0_9PEZI|nr:heme-containing dehydratase protein [Pseudomassariella vexata]ORY59319.1 heme-containing dehydratase protein [Pseudomassariella vexata]